MQNRKKANSTDYAHKKYTRFSIKTQAFVLASCCNCEKRWKMTNATFGSYRHPCRGAARGDVVNETVLTSPHVSNACGLVKVYSMGQGTRMSLRWAKAAWRSQASAAFASGTVSRSTTQRPAAACVRIFERAC